jgi:hypothetical protein
VFSVPLIGFNYDCDKMLVAWTVRLSLRKAVSKKVYRQGFGNRCRATPRADIWIHRPTGSVCRDKRLTRRRLLADIAAVFAFLDCGFPDNPPEEPAVHLIVSQAKRRKDALRPVYLSRVGGQKLLRSSIGGRT